jgi:hypothetical protein
MLLVDKFLRNVEVLYYPPNCTRVLQLRLCQAAAGKKKAVCEGLSKRHRTENSLQEVGYISRYLSGDESKSGDRELLSHVAMGVSLTQKPTWTQCLK